MAGWIRFVRTTVIGGVIVLVPFIVVVVVVGKAFQIMRQVAQPLSAVFPIESVGGIVLLDLIAAGLILLLCFLAGLAARAELAGKMVQGLEQRFLSRIPFYEFVKGMTGSIVAAEEDRTMKTILVRLDDYAQVAFEIERTQGGEVVVFLPGAPNPWSGSVCILAAERVTPLDASMMAAVQNIKHLGKGSGRLTSGQAQAPC